MRLPTEMGARTAVALRRLEPQALRDAAGEDAGMHEALCKHKLL